MDGYWGASIASGDLDETISFQTGEGAPVSVELDRKVSALQAARGWFSPRPASAVAALPDLERLPHRRRGILALKPKEGRPDLELPPLYTSWRADALTTSATLEGLYDRWWGSGRLELEALYTLSYTDSDSDDNALLDSHGWHDTLVLRTRWSKPAADPDARRPLALESLPQPCQFPEPGETSLGFSYYFDVGAAVSYEINIKALDWFGLRYLGFRAGAILGADVDGYSWV